jgi:hypothetical protein
LTLLLLALMSAPAAPPRQVAVIVGSKATPAALAKQPPLRFTDDDALRWALAAQAGFEPEDILVFTTIDDDSKPLEAVLTPTGDDASAVRIQGAPTFTNIRDALGALPYDTFEVTLFYSGHGSDGTMHFEPDGVSDGAVSFGDFQRAVREANGRLNAVFADACHSSSWVPTAAPTKAAEPDALYAPRPPGTISSLIPRVGMVASTQELQWLESGPLTLALTTLLLGAADDGASDALLRMRREAEEAEDTGQDREQTLLLERPAPKHVGFDWQTLSNHLHAYSKGRGVPFRPLVGAPSGRRPVTTLDNDDAPKLIVGDDAPARWLVRVVPIPEGDGSREERCADANEDASLLIADLLTDEDPRMLTLLPDRCYSVTRVPYLRRGESLQYGAVVEHGAVLGEVHHRWVAGTDAHAASDDATTVLFNATDLGEELSLPEKGAAQVTTGPEVMHVAPRVASRRFEYHGSQWLLSVGATTEPAAAGREGTLTQRDGAPAPWRVGGSLGLAHIGRLGLAGWRVRLRIDTEASNPLDHPTTARVYEAAVGPERTVLAGTSWRFALHGHATAGIIALSRDSGTVVSARVGLDAGAAFHVALGHRLYLTPSASWSPRVTLVDADRADQTGVLFEGDNVGFRLDLEVRL